MKEATVRKKIIVVDDNLENLTTIKDTLKYLYEVYTCPSALKMFDLLEHFLPDLILLDVDMPEMNGYDAARKLQSDIKYKQRPFMFLTFREDIEGEIIGLKLGAVDYIHKPFVTPLLLQRIKSRIALLDYQKIEIISIATVNAMNHIREGFVLVDVDNNYLTSNPVMAKMLPGITKISKGDSIFFVKSWPEELNTIENGSVEFSITNESTRYYRASISPVFIEEKTFIGRIFLFTDITDNVNFLTEMEKASYKDTLTGLYNRKHFTELAEADIKRAVRINQSIYMAMVDIDSFRKINDTYGHTAGDTVLKSAANIIKQAIRSYDLVGRYGGEKFVVLFAISDETEVSMLAERIRENMEHVFTSYEGEEIKITCSIGMSKLLKTDTLQTVIQNADEALCAAKNSGRNQVKFYDPMPDKK
ncbi:MAG: diguanylate cyclase [Treponema sp.]|jgi:diguanylate cyclase (GGDEF)-like protein|nr:diguanylate cyclase [Treponema sp.]